MKNNAVKYLIFLSMLQYACEKPQVQTSTNPSAALASITITTPATSPYKTAAESLLIAGKCAPSITGLSTSRGKFLDADCTDQTFALEPIILNSGSFTLTISGRRSDGSEATASVEIQTGSNDILAISKPSGERIYTAMREVEIDGQCRGDVETISASIGTVNTDCAAQGTFKYSVTLPSQEKDYPLTLTANYGGSKAFELKRILTYDKSPPSLAITTPATHYFGRGTGVIVSGTCDSNVTKLSANINLSDSDCGDGIWSSSPMNLSWEKKIVLIKGYDASGNEVTATINLSKALILGSEQQESDGVRIDPDAAVWTDGTKMLIAEPSYHRVLVFNSMPLNSTQAPDFVLGQTSWLVRDLNAGGLSARSLNTPKSVYSDGQRIVVADSGNHRVLIWNAWPTSNFKEANVIVGAPTATHLNLTTDAVHAANLNNPVQAVISGSSLWVVDQGNHRVLRWSAIPSTSGTAADLVVGQVDLNSHVAASGGVSGQSLNSPSYVSFGGGKMAIADQTHHRVLLWNTVPSSSNSIADVVIGQPDFATILPHHSSLSARSLRNPKAVHFAGTMLFIADYAGRILGWNNVPSSSFSAADFVLGQTSTTSIGINSGGISASTLHTPGSMSSSTSKLYVSDMGNARILGYNLSGIGTNAAATFLYGARDYTTYVREVLGGLPFNNPQGVEIGKAPSAVDKYFIADTGNNRILIYNHPPITTSDIPDVILGQPTDGVGTANNAFDPLDPNALNLATPSNRSLNSPRAVMTDGYKLYVADSGNNRILIWNTIPTSNFTPADLVVGQPDFISNVANNTGLGVQGQRLNNPGGVFAISSDGTSANTKLLVADTGNSRVLVWSTLPTANGTVANFAVGQADLNSTSASIASSARMNSPEDMWTNGTKLAISDTLNNRVLVYDTFPVASGASATTIIGQPNGTTNSANTLGRADNTLSGPVGVRSISGTQLYISDSGNNRVLYYNTWPSGTKPSANFVIPQPSFSAAGANVTLSGLSNIGLNSPQKIAVKSDGQIMVPSTLENTVKLWNGVPVLLASPHDNMWFGQRTLQYAVAKELSRFALVNDSLTVNGKLYAIDPTRGLLLGWNTIPENDYVAPDFALGHPNLDRFLPNDGGIPSRSTLFTPQDFASDGTRLVISDAENHRVLIYNTLPTSASALPDVVVGQPNFSSYGANYGGLSAATMRYPRGVAIVNDKLIVGDVGNNRVLIWNTIPTVDGAAADVVIGQPNFTSNGLAISSLNAKTINVPASIVSDGQNLAIADLFNRRVLIWNNLPTSNYAAADLVLGQANFSSLSFRGSGISAREISHPRGLFYLNGILGVNSIYTSVPGLASNSDMRILFWRGMPTQSYQPADFVWGQSTMDSIDPSSAPDRCTGMSAGLSFTSERLYVPCGGSLMIQSMPR